MSLYMPPALQWLGYVAGSAWPQGDEDQMWALGRDWHSAHDQLQEPISEMQSIIAQAADAYPAGAGRDAIVKALTQIAQGEGSLKDLANLLDEMGDAADGMGTEIQYVKIMIITSLADLAVEIMLAWIFPPTAPATEAAAIATTRAVMRVVYDRSIGAIERLLGKVLGKVLGRFGETLSRFLVRHVAMSTFLGTAQDLLIQAGQVGAGHRKGIDGTQLAITAISSAAAGAAGGLPIADLAGKGIVKGIGKFTDHFHLPDITNLLTKKDLTTPELSFARPSVSGMLHGDFSRTVTQTIRPRSTRAFVEGAVSGGVSGMAGAMAGYVAGTGAYSAITGTNFGQNLSSNWGFQPLSSGATAGAIAGGAKGEINFGGKLRLDRFNDGAAFHPAGHISLDDLTPATSHTEQPAPQQISHQPDVTQQTRQPGSTTEQSVAQQPPHQQNALQRTAQVNQPLLGPSAPQDIVPVHTEPRSQGGSEISPQPQPRPQISTEQLVPQPASHQQHVPSQQPTFGRRPEVELSPHAQAEVDRNTSDFSGQLDRAFGLGPSARQDSIPVETEPQSSREVPDTQSRSQPAAEPERPQQSTIRRPPQRSSSSEGWQPQRRPGSPQSAPQEDPAPETGVQARPTPTPTPTPTRASTPEDAPTESREPTPWPTGWELPNTPRFFPAPTNMPYQAPSAPSPDFWLAPSDWSGGASGPSGDTSRPGGDAPGAGGGASGPSNG